MPNKTTRYETSPNTLLEALACGTPGCHISRRHEQIQDGLTGFLTPPGDADAMAARVMQLIEDEGMRLRMGAEAAQDARKMFDIERGWRGVSGVVL